MAGQVYSRGYIAGWAPQILLILAPIVSFPDLSIIQISGIILLVISGYFIVKFANKSEFQSKSEIKYCQSHSPFHGRIVFFFSLLSLMGCYLVGQQQSVYLNGAEFDNLQGRYIALVDASLQGTTISSVLSSLGNLARSFFFIAITSFVAVTMERRSILFKLLLGALVALTLVVNFQVSVSRLQLGFFLLCGCAAAAEMGHPILRFKIALVTLVGVAAAWFLVFSTTQRFEAMYGNSDIAAVYMQIFFGVEMKALGSAILEYFGVATFTLILYISQGIPELLRLIGNNASPYSLGGHSFFLLFSPIFRIFGVNLGADAQSMTNQGAWWGFLGDLYIDFGIMFPVAYLCALYGMVRLAIKFGNGPIYGLAFRALTISLILMAPYIGIFNTYSVSYVAIAILAVYEHRRLNHVQTFSNDRSSPR